MTKFSVVIPHFEQFRALKKCLESLEKQTIKKADYEVIVVDDGSESTETNRVKNLVELCKVNIKLLLQLHKGPAAARNYGIKNAKGEIILIINGDAICEENLLEKHFDFHLKHPQENFALLGFFTWHKTLKVTPFMGWLENGGPYFSYRNISSGEVPWQSLWTCNLSLKRGFLLKNGLFDEDFPFAAWEDIELGYRLKQYGLRLFFDKDAIAYHDHLTSIHSIKNKMRNNGFSVLILKQKIPQKYLPPLGRHPFLFIALDTVFLNAFVVFILEKACLFAEKRLNCSILFDLLLFHYRTEGAKTFFRQ